MPDSETVDTNMKSFIAINGKALIGLGLKRTSEDDTIGFVTVPDGTTLEDLLIVIDSLAHTQAECTKRLLRAMEIDDKSTFIDQ